MGKGHDATRRLNEAGVRELYRGAKIRAPPYPVLTILIREHAARSRPMPEHTFLVKNYDALRGDCDAGGS